jgi:hypothetical protein
LGQIGNCERQTALNVIRITPGGIRAKISCERSAHRGVAHHIRLLWQGL